ncbi:MAG: replication protein [Clostridiales bacterium]|nr:replication protein [Clostridiales bacterium]
MSDPKSRKWQLTLNNPEEKGLDHTAIKNELSELKSIIYYCMADEIGLEQKTPHTHIFIAASSPIRFSSLKRRFPDAHIEQARGTSEENKVYIEKSGKWADDSKSDTSIEGTFEEWGEMPIERPGSRTDLDLLYQLIKDGKSNYEILEESASFILRLTDVERARQTVLVHNFRSDFRELDITYIWGTTGVGKTRSVMEYYEYENVYRVTNYSHPFDNYSGQDVMLFDEYRGDFKIGELLNYLDGYPCDLPARYANKTACFTKVYIISNIDLSSQYPHIQIDQPETWNSLIRRIKKVIYITSGGRYEYSAEQYAVPTVEPEISYFVDIVSDEETPFDSKGEKI